MQYPGHAVKEGATEKAVVRAVQARLVESHCGPVDASGVFGPRQPRRQAVPGDGIVDATGRP